MNSIELQNEHGIYRIELMNRDGMTIEEVFESLIIPVLGAAGYAQESIYNQLAQ